MRKRRSKKIEMNHILTNLLKASKSNLIPDSFRSLKYDFIPSSFIGKLCNFKALITDSDVI